MIYHSQSSINLYAAPEIDMRMRTVLTSFVGESTKEEKVSNGKYDTKDCIITKMVAILPS